MKRWYMLISIALFLLINQGQAQIWTFATSVEGWVSRSSAAQVRWSGDGDGRLYMDTYGSDPGMVKDVSLSASSYNKLKMKIFTDCANTNCTLYFKRAGSTTVFTAKSITLIRGGDDLPTYELDLTDVAEWTGTITLLRIDPSDNCGSTTTPGFIAFDLIQLYYVTPIRPDLVAIKSYYNLLGMPGIELTRDPKIGEKIQFGFDFRNDNAKINSPVTAKLFLDEQLFWSTTFSDLDIATMHTLALDNDKIWTATSGSHQARWVIDSENGVIESNESNNAATRTWNTVDQFDLISGYVEFKDASGLPIQRTVGEQVYFYYRYSIAGSGAITPFTIQCFLNGTLFESKAILSGNGGTEYIIQTSSPWTATAGTHSVEWVLDAGNSISESNESNNRSSAGYTTAIKQVDLIAPTPSGTVTSDEIRLDWSDAGASYYEVIVDNNPGLGSPEIYLGAAQNYTSTEYTISGNFLCQNPYNWKIIAHYSDGTSVSSTVGTFTYTPPAMLAPWWMPIYRMYKAADSDHFYTTSDNHRQIAINSGYMDERVEGYLSVKRFSSTDMVNVFRFYDKNKRSHYYTTSENDKDNKIMAGLTYEGLIGFAYANSAEGLVPLYYLRSTTDDFFTTSEFERDNAVLEYGFEFVGIIGYVSLTGDNTYALFLESQVLAGSGINTANGNFSHYTKSSFNIAGTGFPLSFDHVYNSMSAMLKTNLLPLGPGWSHSYLAYIDLAYANNQVALCWPDGTIDLYNKSGSTYSPVLKSVYDEMTSLTSTTFEVKRKNQVVYTFQVPSGASTGYPAVLKSIRDRNNNTLNCTYETAEPWRLLSVTDPSGRSLQFSYSTNTGKTNLLIQVSGPLSRSVYFDYDSDGLLYKFTDAEGNVTQYFYDTTLGYDHILKKVLLPRGNYIDNTYEARKMKSQKFKGNASSLSASYQANRTTITDEKGRSTAYDYNSSQFVEKITDLSGPSGYEQYWYEDANNPSKATRMQDRNGYMYYYTYDTKGNVLQMQSPTGTHVFTYTTMNDPLTYKDPLNKTTYFNYDTPGNLRSKVDPLSHSTQWNRLSNGLVESIVNPMSHTTSLTYDPYGNVASIRDPMNNTTTFIYDVGSRQTQSTDARLQTSFYSYDKNDLIKTITDPSNGITQYEYDANGNQRTITDAKNQPTYWDYNDLDQLISTTNANGNKITYTYNEDGSLASRSFPGGPSCSYGYDQSGRLGSISGSGYSCTFTYDANGNLKQASDGSGNISFIYDAGNRMTSSTDFYYNTVTYGYDAADHITSITYPGGKIVRYTYYDDGRLETVRDWHDKVTTYIYRADGLLQEIQYPNSTRCIYSYDNADRLTGVRNETGSGQVIASYTYGLDAAGNHISETYQEPYSAPMLTATSIQYGFDAANRLQNAGEDLFTFETNGNLRSQTGSRNANYTWDWDKRLIQIAGDYSAEYIYDVFGHRRAATRSGTTVRYVLDINGPMSQVLMEKDASGTVLNYYVYGLGLISRIKPDGTTHYYHYNNVGSTIAITDQSQTITHKYQYDPFGRVLQSQEADANPFRFVGQWGVMDEGNGLHFMRARYYDAVLGRFLTEDLEWKCNLFNYAENNPSKYYDPNGSVAVLVSEIYWTAGMETGTYLLKKGFRASAAYADFMYNNLNSIFKFGKKPLKHDFTLTDAAIDFGSSTYSLLDFRKSALKGAFTSFGLWNVFRDLLNFKSASNILNKSFTPLRLKRP